MHFVPHKAKSYSRYKAEAYWKILLLDYFVFPKVVFTPTELNLKHRQVSHKHQLQSSGFECLRFYIQKNYKAFVLNNTIF